ncbi:MAG: hypothetical protein LBD81_01300, partial [Holosporaceae bacterium]|nr:hypothetical protein [Holosporaceae bacterium]
MVMYSRLYRPLYMVLVVCAWYSYGATSDFVLEETAEEDILLNEYVGNLIKESGIEAHLYFSGDANLTASFINQKISNGMESGYASFQSHVDLKYAEKVDNHSFGFEIVSKFRSGIVKR